MPSLTNNVTRDFCRQILVEERANPATVKLICDRAQGHPLYLRYLIDLVNSGTDDDELATLPLIEGSTPVSKIKITCRGGVCHDCRKNYRSAFLNSTGIPRQSING